jgi:hypothetical protein
MKTDIAALAAACACLTGCLSHKVEMEPIEVKPIHVTVDVNVRVQRELDKYFDFDAPKDDGTETPDKAAEKTDAKKEER